MKKKLFSPKLKNFRENAKIKIDNSKCEYIDKYTNKRCMNNLDFYPEYCKMHTIIEYNVYIDKSNILNGNGLFAGAYGFKKNDIIGIYSNPETKVSLGDLYKRCDNYDKKEKCWEYVFCKIGHKNNTTCWDNLDIRSSLMRNINDAYNTKYRNNSYFMVKNNKVYVIASVNIKPKSEIFINYGKDYWN